MEHGPEGLEAVPYRFTGKELDEETGLYYYGARYLNPRTSRWISADPGLEAFLPVAPINDEARKHNKDLPGGGGIFNPVNLAIYQYAGNNPLKYVDPDGTEKKSVQEVLRSAWNLLRGFFEGKPTAVGAEGSLAVPLPFGYKLVMQGKQGVLMDPSGMQVWTGRGLVLAKAKGEIGEREAQKAFEAKGGVITGVQVTFRMEGEEGTTLTYVADAIGWLGSKENIYLIESKLGASATLRREQAEFLINVSLGAAATPVGKKAERARLAINEPMTGLRIFLWQGE